MAGWMKALPTVAGTSEILNLPHLSLQLLRLASGERAVVRTGRTQETAAVFASGRVSATADGRFWSNCGTALPASPWAQFAAAGRARQGGGADRPRRRISAEFRPLAHTSPWPLHQALWLPPDAPLELQAIEPAEVLLIATDLGSATDRAAGRQPELARPQIEDSREVGSGAFRRLVTPLLIPGTSSVSLALGETYNPPGGWSTYPPHRHDRRADLAEPDETQHEEIYIFRFAPAAGFGLARVYEDRASGRAPGEGVPGGAGPIDQALVFRHGDVLAIVQGYHTLVSAPGYHLHYLWAMAGPRAVPPVQRADLTHAWVDQEER